uniref:ras-related protein Rab5-like isoform X3 n=1 Tax=Myxine glutinosa TaxID=7769 RepID=UPI00358EFF2B
MAGAQPKVSVRGPTVLEPKEEVRLRLVLLGDTVVGKSSLALRFVQDKFVESLKNMPGAAFLTKDICLGRSLIRYEIWDTVGQERFNSLAPIYYRNAQAAIIAYDISNKESFDRAKRWLRELLEQRWPDMVMALVGNKTDLDNRRAVSNEEAGEYAREQNILFMEVSAKTGANVQEIFTEAGPIWSADSSKVWRTPTCGMKASA